MEYKVYSFTVMYNNKRSKEADKRRSEKDAQYSEAVSIQHSFGVYRDKLLFETVDLITPEEIFYYLSITFGGVVVAAIPDTIERGLVLERHLAYQINSQ